MPVSGTAASHPPRKDAAFATTRERNGEGEDAEWRDEWSS